MITTDPLGRFRTDLVIEPMKKDGSVSAYRLVDPVSALSHVMTELEYAVATCMDGKRGVIEVARAAARLGHPVQLEHVELFHRELEGMSFVLRDSLPPAPPVLNHHADASRFIDEAKQALAQGRIEVARDLLDAALAIDRAANGVVLGTPLDTMQTGALPGQALGPVLDFLTDWSPPLPTLEPLPTSATSAWPRPFEPIDIPMDTGITQLPPRRRPRAPMYLASALVIVALMAAASATDLISLPQDTPSLVVHTPPPPPVAVAVLPAPIPIAAPAPINAIKPIDVLDATAAVTVAKDADVVTHAKGRFARVLVSSGVKVQQGQRVGVVVDASGRQTMIVSPRAGVFEVRVPLGKRVRPGDVVAIIR